MEFYRAPLLLALTPLEKKKLQSLSWQKEVPSSLEEGWVVYSSQDTSLEGVLPFLLQEKPSKELLKKEDLLYLPTKDLGEFLFYHPSLLKSYLSLAPKIGFHLLPFPVPSSISQMIGYLVEESSDKTLEKAWEYALYLQERSNRPVFFIDTSLKEPSVGNFLEESLPVFLEEISSLSGSIKERVSHLLTSRKGVYLVRLQKEYRVEEEEFRALLWYLFPKAPVFLFYIPLESIPSSLLELFSFLFYEPTRKILQYLESLSSSFYLPPLHPAPSKKEEIRFLWEKRITFLLSSSFSPEVSPSFLEEILPPSSYYVGYLWGGVYLAGYSLEKEGILPWKKWIKKIAPHKRLYPIYPKKAYYREKISSKLKKY